MSDRIEQHADADLTLLALEKIARDNDGEVSLNVITQQGGGSAIYSLSANFKRVGRLMCRDELVNFLADAAREDRAIESK